MKKETPHIVDVDALDAADGPPAALTVPVEENAADQLQYQSAGDDSRLLEQDSGLERIEAEHAAPSQPPVGIDVAEFGAKPLAGVDGAIASVTFHDVGELNPTDLTEHVHDGPTFEPEWGVQDAGALSVHESERPEAGTDERSEPIEGHSPVSIDGAIERIDAALEGLAPARGDQPPEEPVATVNEAVVVATHQADLDTLKETDVASRQEWREHPQSSPLADLRSQPVETVTPITNDGAPAPQASVAEPIPAEVLQSVPLGGLGSRILALENTNRATTLLRSERLRSLARSGARYILYGLGAYMAVVGVLLVVYRFADPPASTLMVYQALIGRDVDQRWVDIEDVSPQLVRAVIVSEDGQFCQHWGVDFAAMEQAIERAVDGVPRGASTISMQVTKNLFLWQSKSYVRKAIELPLTLLMELIWPKRRILEIYLNIAEWAPGVFGAEAAARHHFGKPASDITEREAALLAAALPNPYRRDAGDPGPRTTRKANVVQSRSRAEGFDVAGCIYD